MIDTMVIYTDKFRIQEEKNKLTHKMEIDNETGIDKESYYYNYKPLGEEKVLVKVDIGQRLMVNFSVPRVIGGKGNYKPVSKEEYAIALQRVESILNEAGIEAKRQDFKLSRVDIFKNIKVRYPFGAYEPVFRWLQPSRMDPRSYGTTYTFMNGSREICFYDKTLEMVKEYGESIESNIMRGEVRLKKHNVIQKVLKIDKAMDLISNWDVLGATYERTLRGLFGDPELREEKPELKDEATEIVIIAEEGWRKAQWMFTAKAIGDMDWKKFKEVLSKERSKSSVSRICKNIEIGRRCWARYDGKAVFGELVSELGDKFLSKDEVMS